MSDTELRQRLAAILAADVAGYSRLMAGDDRATVAALDAARHVFRTEIAANHGRVIDMAGDSVLAVFETATGAVAAAIEVQRKVNAMADASPQDRRMRFRIGVHLGDVIEKADGTVYGDGVNIAARLEGIAPPGGVAVSHSVHATVRDRIAAQFEDLGEHQVKNIARPVRAFFIRLDGDGERRHRMTDPDLPWRFGRFELQPRQRRLLIDGRDAGLAARTLDVLLVLAQRAGRWVRRNELIDLAWPGLVVEENDVSVEIGALRKVLGGAIIATVPGYGYRFTTPVETPAVTVSASPAGAEPAALEVPELPKLPTHLPATLPPLIGREDDLATLGALLDQHRLVTVVGAGGLGKTLLAQHLLAGRERHHAHGVCWIELAPVSDASALPGAIAAAVGVRAGEGDDPVGALARALAPLDVLIALDNAEHLLAEVAAIAEALHRLTPKLRLVVTSQAPLKVAAERVLRLGPLAVPEGPLQAREALAFGAVALFVERAQAADARFVLTDAAAPTVIELCRSLDGMALAIELAAARVPTLGLHRLASSMQERLRLLTSSRNRTAPERQQTLRGALEWSHALLDEREQAVFRRLAVVAGSASLELIQRIAVCARWNEWEVLDALDLLVERSLVAVLAAAEGRAPRYRLLESPRLYARERLEAVGELEPVQRKHAFAVRDLLTAMREERMSGLVPRESSLDAARADNDNAVDAFAWARAAAEGALAMEIGSLLLNVLRLVAAAQRLALCDAVETLATADLPPALRAQAWFDIAQALADARPRRALVAAQRAVEIIRSAPARFPEAERLLYLSLCRVAITASNLRDDAEAHAMMAAALKLEQTTWVWPVLRSGVEAQFFLQQMLGNAAETVRLAQRLIEIDRSTGRSGMEARLWLADAQLNSGDAAASVSSGREVLAQLEGSRDEQNVAYARMNLAAAYLRLDDGSHARPLLWAGWSQTAALDFMRPYFADYLALLAALDTRPEAVARLCGYADAAYAAFEDMRHPNEAAAIDRARVLARAALGDAGFERLQAEGASCSGEEAAALAFGHAQ